MKLLKKATALLLLCALLCNPAFAYENVDCAVTQVSQFELLLQPRGSSQIRQYIVSLTVTGTNEMCASYMIYGTSSSMTEIGASSIKIQKLVGSRWLTVTTEDGTTSTNASSHGQDVYFSTVSGVTYRAIIELFATNSKGTDTRSATTPTATA